MAQYHFLDESGDPGLNDSTSSSKYLALAIVQLSYRAPLKELAEVRRIFHFSKFEFKYHKTIPLHKDVFFRSIQIIPFRVRAMVASKTALKQRYAGVKGQTFMTDLIAQLTLRTPELDIAQDTLIVDGATPAFRQELRIKLSRESRTLKRRSRPFQKIVSGDSYREDGLQLTDMVVGAVRDHVAQIRSDYYETFANKVVDLWEIK